MVHSLLTGTPAMGKLIVEPVYSVMSLKHLSDTEHFQEFGGRGQIHYSCRLLRQAGDSVTDLCYVALPDI